jgi:hypothetical protein
MSGTAPSRLFVRELVGVCSFCASAANERVPLVGLDGRSCRICKECIDLSLDMIADFQNDTSPPTPYEPRSAADRESFLSKLEAEFESANLDRRVIDAHRGRLRDDDLRKLVAEYVCSFCDAARANEHFTLIPSPTTRTFICETCLGGASAFVLRSD